MRTYSGMRWVAALTLVLAAGAINVSQSWDNEAGNASETEASPADGRGDELRASLTALAPVQTVAVGDVPLTRARKERYNAALAQLLSQQEMFKIGRATFDSTLEPLERLAKAAEPVLKREDYLRLLSECVVVAKALEAAAKARTDEGFAPTASVHDATFVRADLEVRLLEARAADKK